MPRSSNRATDTIRGMEQEVVDILKKFCQGGSQNDRKVGGHMNKRSLGSILRSILTSEVIWRPNWYEK